MCVDLPLFNFMRHCTVQSLTLIREFGSFAIAFSAAERIAASSAKVPNIVPLTFGVALLYKRHNVGLRHFLVAIQLLLPSSQSILYRIEQESIYPSNRSLGSQNIVVINRKSSCPILCQTSKKIAERTPLPSRVFSIDLNSN